MKTISVPDMMCAHCVERITDGLNAAGLKFTVSLEKKLVTLDGDETAAAAAVSELEDLGFSPEMQ